MGKKKEADEESCLPPQAAPPFHHSLRCNYIEPTV